MIEILCAKIGGIWCYWPQNNAVAFSVILGVIVILLLIIWLFAKKFG